MSKYTTGELAKLCGVSVRTVQYYDSREILMPSALSEGGRRLYSEADMDKMKVICFLRSLELPIDSIKEILSQEKPEEVIGLLLQEQENRLRAEIAQKQQSADRIAETQKHLRRLGKISAESMGDIAYILENKKHMRRLYLGMLIIGLFMDAIQVATIMLWILRGLWWPFAAAVPVVIGLGVWISAMYYGKTVYICPHCHKIFKPRFKEAFFAKHTPYTRKLTCPECGYHGYCVETYAQENQNAEN